MATLLDIVHDSLVKGGVSAEKVKEFTLANQDLAKVNLPAEIETGFNSLMSVDAAVTNPIVKSRLRADFLKTADDTLLDRAGKYLDAESAEAIKKETSTYKRLEMFADKMEDLKKAAATANKGGDKDEVARLNNEMAQLRELVKTEKANAQSEVAKVKSEYHQREVKRAFDVWASNQKLPSHLMEDPDRGEILRFKFERELQKHPGLSYDVDEQGNLTLGKRGESGLEKYFDATNKEVSWPSFTDKWLADNKLLAVSDAPPTPTTVVVPQNGPAQKVEVAAGLLD
jgi:hypothetical protein